MDLNIWDMSPEEHLYTYTQSSQIQGQSGCIGHLRGDMDTDGNGFFTNWDDHRANLKTYEFKKEFDEVINALRSDEQYGGILKNRSSLAKYCYSHPQCAMDDGHSYGVRVDSREYSYMCRLDPNRGVYNFYIYAYKKEYLDKHMEAAAKGIRFIDPHYKEKFRIPDGGIIRVTYPDGTRAETSCRYIDDYHLEVGRHAFHICEYAELLENQHAMVEPVTPPIEKNRRKEKAHAGIDR